MNTDHRIGTRRYFVFSGAVCAFYLVLIALVPTTFILHKLLEDRLNYFLMAKSIAESGSPAVSLAVNSAPLIYSSGMSYIYALAIKAASVFEYQLRGMQALNLLFLFAFAALALRYLVSRLPGVPIAPIALVIAVSLTLDSHWQLSILAPNANIFPALVTVGCFLAFQDRNSLAPTFSACRFQTRMAVAIVIGTIGSLIKISLITIPIALFLERFASLQHIRKTLTALVGLACLGIAVVYLLNGSVATEYLGALIKAYVFPSGEPTVAGFISSVAGAITNLVLSALPDRIIPNFRHIFVESYYINTFNPNTITPYVAFGMILGISVSTITLIGAITLRHSCKLEMVMLLLCLLPFTIVTNSTARYLMAYQPLIWACFIAGILKFRPFLPRINVLFVAPVAVLILITQINSISLRSKGDLDLKARIGEVSQLYSGMLDYLRKQDPSTTLGVQHFKVHEYSTMMWRAATDIPFYVPDDGLPAQAKERRVLAIVTCIKPDCKDFEKARQETFSHIEKTGRYKFNLAYAEQSPIARGEIYEVTGD